MSIAYRVIIPASNNTKKRRKKEKKINVKRGSVFI